MYGGPGTCGPGPGSPLLTGSAVNWDDSNDDDWVWDDCGSEPGG